MRAPDPLPPQAPLQHLRRRQRWLALGLALLSGVVLVLSGLDLRGHWRAGREQAETQAALYARLVEGHVSRLVDATAGQLRVLAAHPLMNEQVEQAALNALLGAQLPGQVHLRSLSLLDEDGLVLASSAAGDIGGRINLDRLGRSVRTGLGVRLGPVQLVRELGELGRPTEQTPNGTGVAALPMVQGLASPHGPRWLVGLINVDYIANQHALITQGQPVHVMTLSLTGQVIDGAGRAETGSDASRLTPFVQFLPKQESGRYVGKGIEGDDDIAAFRTSRSWPLVVVAEHPIAPLVDAWRQEARMSAGIGAAALALLALTGVFLQRGLRREARDLQAVTALHAEVARAEERWQLALDSAGHGVWDFDLQRGRGTLSGQLMALLGHPAQPAEWSVDQWRQQVHPEDLPAAEEVTRQHLRGASTGMEVELRMRRADGSWLWVLSRAAAVSGFDAGGRINRLVGTLTNIDARKRAERAMRESEARQQAILRSALDGIITIDAEGRVVDFNPAAEHIFGLQASALLGQRMHEFIVPKRHRVAHQEGMARYRATGHGPVLNQRIQIEGLRADGTEFPMELAIVPVATESGEVFTATVRDISERQRIEAELRESRLILDKVGSIAGVGGWTLDLRTQRVHWTDQTAVLHDRLAGHQPASLDEAVGYYAPGALERVDAAIARAISEGQGFDLEVPLITATNRHIWVRAVGRAEFEGERPVRLVGAFQDITTRVVAERELQLARSREVQMGARIQQTLLVDNPDQRLPGLWMSTLSQSSQGIDGDFIQLVRLGERGVDLIVGDVMGKGVAAALMGAATKMQISHCFTELLARPDHDGAAPEPSEMMATLHRAMTPRLQELDAFVTLSYLRLDVCNGRLTWVGCGHEEALLLTASGGVHRLPNQHPPLGVLSDQTFQQDSLPLGLEDAVFVCSDGAADALLPDGRRLSRDRVETLLQSLLARLSTPAAALHALRREIEATGAQLTDDLTLALALVKGDARAASRRELRGGLSDIGHVRGLVTHRATAAGLDEVQASLFAVACVEAYTNVVRHTQGRPEQAPVEIVVLSKPEELVVEIVTLGEPFVPPAEAAQTDFTVFPEGGFGLTIMEQASDRVEHLHSLGVNTVRLTRWLN
jgi:PAS domain S-box-containing protein